MTGSRFRTVGAAFAATLFVLTPVWAAEFPNQAKDRPIAKRGAEPTKKLPSCDVGGVEGVMSPSGVCVKMSGFVSAGVWGRSLR